MSNSSLTNYTKLSPNSSNRTAKIDRITIHHMAGNLTVEACGAVFQDPNRQASSNYGVGSDGRIGLYVDEHRRAWTSSNRENDNRAVTIEVANDGGAPNWHISDKALASTIALCTDICKRNGIRRLNYTGDKTGNLTMHKWFTNTACPGPYLESKFPYIADEVNKRLGATEAPKEPEQTKQEAPTATNYLVQVKISNLRIRKGPGTNYGSATFIKKGVYTIVAESSGQGSAKGWGKLKSGAGWISLDYCTKMQ